MKEKTLLLRFRLTTAVALCLVSCVWNAAVMPARAQDASSTLDEAVKLFEDGKYLDAQEALVGLDRSDLAADEAGSPMIP